MDRLTFLALAAVVPGSAFPRTSPGFEDEVRGMAFGVRGTVAVFVQGLSAAGPAVVVNAGESFPAASIIKLTIMLAAYRAIDRDQLGLDTRIPFTRPEIVGGSETFARVAPGDTATVAALLEAMIQQSDNTAANAPLDHFGFAGVNAVIREAGLLHTRMQRRFMHFSAVHENLTTAADIGTLLVGIGRGALGMAQPFASRASCRAMVDTMLGQEDREKIAAGLPAGVPLANKTGELPGVRHDAGIVDPYGSRPYVLVVLEKDLANQGGGVAGIARISRAVYAQVRAGAGR